jgi:hypothetical protein
MVVPGYDPADLDDALEQQLSADDVSTYLTDEEWAACQNGDASLLDLLSGSEIDALLDREGVTLEEAG